MTRHISTRRGSFRLNCLAAAISSAALFGLALTFQATPAGAGHEARANMAQISLSIAAPQAVGGLKLPEGQSTAKGDVSADSAELQKQVQAAVHSSRLAMELYIAMLELGQHRLEKTSDYTASFFKQERPDGQEMQELQNLDVKVRHAPFSVYMNWIEGGDEGREILYVDGQLDNRMLVKLGGLGKFAPALKLDPLGDRAMKEARHPITDMGLLNLTRKIIAYRQNDLKRDKGVRWQLIPDQKCFDRDCLCLVVEYDSPEHNPEYRKTLTFIDKQLSLPVCVKNYAWPGAAEKIEAAQLDEATCIEFYGYKDVRLNVGLKDVDFDKGNENYKFVRR